MVRREFYYWRAGDRDRLAGKLLRAIAEGRLVAIALLLVIVIYFIKAWPDK